MTKIILMLLLLVALVVVGPFAAIWALNTLFPALSIPINFSTWLATAVLLSLSKASITKKD